MINDCYLNVVVVVVFSTFQYSSLDTSPLSVYVMHPFWNSLVKVKKNQCKFPHSMFYLFIYRISIDLFHLFCLSVCKYCLFISLLCSLFSIVFPKMDCSKFSHICGFPIHCLDIHCVNVVWLEFLCQYWIWEYHTCAELVLALCSN